MNNNLKKIKQDFKEFLKEKNAKLKYRKTPNFEILTLLPNISNRHKAILIEFIYIINEVGLDVLIKYYANNYSQGEIDQTFNFSQLEKDKETPIIEEEDKLEVIQKIKYEAIEGKLKSAIPVADQVETFVRIIKNNWDKIIDHINTI